MKRVFKGQQRAKNQALRIIVALSILTFATPTSAQISAATAIDRLESALRIHPGDPDLLLTLARKLADVGRGADAIAKTRAFLARWPERRPDARVEIAGALIDSGNSAGALVLLDEELKVNPRSGTARFYRGMAFRADGLVAESNREFAFAARIAPSLRAESLLAQALGLFELGQEENAVTLLRQILEIDPTSESAIRARLMLRQREVLDLQRRWRLDAHAGFEWDDNVLLESATNESAGSDRADFRGVTGMGATIRALTTERVSMSVGYRFDQSTHDDLGSFDLLTNSGFMSGSLELHDNVILRLDGLAWNTRQDGHNELTAGTLRPNLILSMGPDWGAIRAFAQYEGFEYAAKPVIPSWEQDGYSLGGGLEHFLPLPLPKSFLSTSVSYQHNQTQAGTSGLSDGFDGDNDYGSTRVRIKARLGLPASIRARLEAGYTYARYQNINFLNALETLRFKKRRDDIASARVELSRQIVPHAELEVYWRGTWRMSNTKFFDYEQHVVGVLLRVSTD